MHKIITCLLLLILVSCKETEVTGFQDKPIVESYLYAGESPTVKISKLVAFTSDMQFSDMDVAKLNVTITDQTSGKKFTLASLGTGVYGNTDLIISEGHTYRLSFPYNGQEVSATTLVPEKPVNMTISASTISIAQRGETAGPGGEMPDPVNIAWSNNDQGYYFIYVKNVESVKLAIDTRNGTGNDFFRNQPISTNQYELNARSFKYYGQHRIILYKIRPEYVLFFQEYSTSSLSISEIKANIENGMGIFTGVNSASTYLYVGKP